MLAPRPGLLAAVFLLAGLAHAEDRGAVLHEYWLGISGTTLSALTSDARYPASPSGISLQTACATPANMGDSYGSRLRGYLHPPVTGTYRFWVAGDDQCELWLSTTDESTDKVLIASTYAYTGPQEWTKYASQQSLEVTLQAGSRYYIEALHKEGNGQDSLAVAWAYGSVARQVIPGEFLSPAASLPTPETGMGFVQREWWTGLAGTSIVDLTGAPAFPATPSGRDYLASFEAPVFWGDNYGTRMRGFVKPTQTGEYQFWISGDDNCQLWLSHNADPLQKGLIASVPGHTATREWTKYPQQHSVVITLQAGASYYIEALHKEGSGGDSVAVAWTGPGIGSTPAVIAGSFLSPAEPTNPTIPVSAGSGSIAVETWTGITGNSLTALASAPAFPLRPAARNVLTSFKAQSNAGDNYGRRVRGYVCPAITGTYRFWLASDDEGELRLSSDENPANATVVARALTWTGEEQWDKFPEQQSAPITLIGGQRYYIEARQKEGTGGDHLAVAWVGPSLIRGVIPGAFLAPLPLPIIDGTREFIGSTTATLSATIPGATIRYTTDGSTPTAGSPTYTAPITVSTSTVITAALDIGGNLGEPTQAIFLQQGNGTGLAGSYFVGEALQGTPVQRLDPVLQFLWGTSAPISGIPADHFSARWQGEIETQLNEEYTLILRSDDGVRVWLDGTLVLNDWTYHGATDRTCVLPAGRHALTIEYMEGAVQAELQMFWQSAHQVRRIVPSTQLYPLLGVQGTIPPSSLVSPLYLEFAHETGASPTATVAGSAFATHHLDDTLRYLNVPLDQSQPTSVTVSSGAGASLSGSITWAATQLTGHTESTLRKNDSLLLQFPEAGTLSITNYSGTYLGPVSVTAGQLLPVLFSKAGEFTVRLNVQGVEVSTLDVTVVTADLSRTILCEVGFTRPVAIDIDPADAPLTFIGNSQLQVTTQAITQDLADLRITPLRRGTPRLQARIHGPHGPLVAEQAIQEFTIDNAALHSAAINAQTGIGTVTLIMRPYIPEQLFTMTMFAHAATFKGGATSLSISSTGGPSSNGEPPMIQRFDTATNETIGVFRFDLEVPENESKYCFRVARAQEETVEGNGAFLPTAGSILGLQANLAAASMSLLTGLSPGGTTGDGPTTNVNGDVCHILAYASVIFTRAVDSSEDEVSESSNSEQWSSRTWSLVTADYCEKGKKGDGNCNAVSYKLKVSDPPAFGGPLDNQLPALFGGSNKESDCKTCTGSCGAVTPAMDSGTIPGMYTTSIEVCGLGDNDTTGDAVGGVFYVSKLDAFGRGSGGSGNSTTIFPHYAETLKKRTGTVVDPVIQIDGGGDESVDGCSLYGWAGEPYCIPKNKWSFTAIARDPQDAGSNVPTSKGYSIKWKNVPGHENSSDISLSNVTFPVGRHMPRLEVWFTNPNPPAGTTAEPKLVSFAEIHSIVVEPHPASNCGGKNADVEPKQRHGTQFLVRNDAGGQTVDARLSILGHAGSDSLHRVRGRVSLDGYPQNQYWVKAADAEDLPQVVGVQDGATQTYYLQGYDAPSTSFRDLTLKVEGQALIENCSDCAAFLLTTVSSQWQPTDEEKFTGFLTELVGPSQLDEDNRATPDADREIFSFPQLSQPAPHVTLSSVTAYDVTISGSSFAIALQGDVYDPIADNVPRKNVSAGGADIDSVDILLDGAQHSTVTLTSTDDAGTGFWKQHPYRGIIPSTSVSAAIPEDGRRQITVRTTENVAGMTGEQTVEISFAKQPLPGGGSVVSDGSAQQVASLYLGSQPSDATVDSLQFYYANRAPTAGDPLFTESASVLVGRYGPTLRGLTTLTPSVAGTVALFMKSGFSATIPVLSGSSPDTITVTQDQQQWTLTESAPDSRVFIGGEDLSILTVTLAVEPVRTDGIREYAFTAVLTQDRVSSTSAGVFLEDASGSAQFTGNFRAELTESAPGSRTFASNGPSDLGEVHLTLTGTPGDDLTAHLVVPRHWSGDVAFGIQARSVVVDEWELTAANGNAQTNAFRAYLDGQLVTVQLPTPFTGGSQSFAAQLTYSVPGHGDQVGSQQQLTFTADPIISGLYHSTMAVAGGSAGQQPGVWFVEGVSKTKGTPKGSSIPTTIRVRGLFSEYDKVELSIRRDDSDEEIVSGLKVAEDKQDEANYLQGGSNGFIYLIDDPASDDEDDIIVIVVRENGTIEKVKAKKGAHVAAVGLNSVYNRPEPFKGQVWYPLSAYVFCSDANYRRVLRNIPYFFITEEAEMPPIKGAILHLDFDPNAPNIPNTALYLQNTEVTYECTINYNRAGAGGNVAVVTAGTYQSGVLGIEDPDFPNWDIKAAMQTERRGGTLTLKATIKFPSAPHAPDKPLTLTYSYTAQIRGVNPTPQAIQTYLAANSHPWFSAGIVSQESRFKQFNTPRAANVDIRDGASETVGTCNQSFDGGRGIFQLTNQAFTGDQNIVWSWQANANMGLTAINAARGIASNHLAREVGKAPGQAGTISLTIAGFTFTHAGTAPALPILDAGTIKYFNGAGTFLGGTPPAMANRAIVQWGTGVWEYFPVNAFRLRGTVTANPYLEHVLTRVTQIQNGNPNPP